MRYLSLAEVLLLHERVIVQSGGAAGLRDLSSLESALAQGEWGYACDVIAPSLIPKRPGVQRKHDKRDATDLARLHRAGELVAIHVPTEAEERVRDVVRCGETFRREILKSRHYILKSLARRGFVFREGTN